MCGIAGYINFKDNHTQKEVLIRMINTLNHRGPDGNRTLIHKFNQKVELGFAHSRLSIIDLTHSADQPMRYKDFIIVFNGEIYNYKEIKSELLSLGHSFVTSSDTEVILHAFEQWNVKCVDKFIGMFAFHIYDEIAQKSYFFRDRVGVKPFYVYVNNDIIIFGSELKALMAHPEFKKEIDLKSVTQFFKYGYIHSPNSIFSNTQQIIPGMFWEIDLVTKNIKKQTYWSVKEAYKKPKLTINFDEAKDELEKILISSCSYRMVADVPIGVFLSGGYDSTLVTSLLTNHTSSEIKTFTIGFEDKKFNEAEFAKEIAKHLGTNHQEHYCTQKDALEIIPKLSYYYDEPFFDISSIPSILLSEFTKKNVTVALSADGGDEIFAGYEIHERAIILQQKLKKYPRFSSYFTTLLSKFVGDDRMRIKHNLNGISEYYKSEVNEFAFLLNLMSEKKSTKNLKKYLNHLDLGEYESEFDRSISKNTKFNSNLDQILMTDYLTYLPNNILTKVDRATMSASLEGREPLLDHRIIEFAAQLPDDFKYDNILQKRILKEITHKYVPKEIMERPKMGFILPLKQWLRNELKDYVMEVLNEKNLNNIPFLNTQNIIIARDKNFEGNDNYYDIVWASLQFVSWYNHWIKP